MAACAVAGSLADMAAVDVLASAASFDGPEIPLTAVFSSDSCIARDVDANDADACHDEEAEPPPLQAARKRCSPSLLAASMVRETSPAVLLVWRCEVRRRLRFFNYRLCMRTHT